MDDDVDWTYSRPKRRKSCYFSTGKRVAQKLEDDDVDDWCIPKKPKRRKSCYVSNKRKVSEPEDEPITIDKVLGFLNGDDDLIQFSNLKPIRNSKAKDKNINDNDKVKEDDAKSVQERERDIEERNKDTSESKYDIDVSIEVKPGDNEFDDDTVSETIELPEIPPSDEDDDLTDVFGAQKPIITSVTSLRQNRKESEYVDVLTVDGEKTLEENRKATSNEYDETRTNNHTVVSARHDDLLTPVRYEPVYEFNTKRNVKPKSQSDYEYTLPVRRRKTKCKHCDKYFFREDLNRHMMDILSAKHKIIDKLLQIPVVKIVDVAKDINLDPKLKARLKDLIFKRKNPKKHYTLRHCVHCEKSFITIKQFNNHIVDVILGLGKGAKVLNYNVVLKTNNTIE